MSSCVRCGATAVPGDRFCGGCGAPLAAPGQDQPLDKDSTEQTVMRVRSTLGSAAEADGTAPAPTPPPPPPPTPIRVDDPQRTAAGDPDTPLDELMTIAHTRADLRPVVAENPSTYPDLLAWLGMLGDPDVDRALARRAAGSTTAADSVTAKSAVVDPPAVGVPVASPPAADPSDARPSSVRPLGTRPPGAAISGSSRRAPVLYPLRPITSTVLITLFFGLFGMIPASKHSTEASREGRPTNKYWKAFGVTFVVEIAAVVLVYAVVVSSATHAINDYSVSGGEDSGVAQTSAAYFTSEESGLDSQTAVASFNQVQSDTLQFSDSDGYSASLAVTVYAPVPIRAVPTEQVCETSSGISCGSYRDFDLSSVCDDDPATTGAVRVDITATNTTSGFPLQMNYDFTASDANDQFAIGASFSDGDSCDANGVNYNDPIQPGASVTKSIWVILDDWVTPNAPNGDPQFLDSSAAISFSWGSEDRSLTANGDNSVPLTG